MTPAEIAAAPWWRWCEGLRTLCGHRVHSVEDGVWTLQKQRGANVWTEVKLREPKPDLACRHLPGWLLYLSRERTGTYCWCEVDGPGYAVYQVCESTSGQRCALIGTGPTELDALLAALQEVTK